MKTVVTNFVGSLQLDVSDRLTAEEIADAIRECWAFREDHPQADRNRVNKSYPEVYLTNVYIGAVEADDINMNPEGS